MKRLLCVALAALMMLALLPAAQGEPLETYEAVAVCADLTERIALKQKPEAESDSVCLIYGGTPVTVLDADMGNGFALIAVEDVAGYLPADRLMRKNRNYGAPELLFRADVKKKQGADLRTAPDASADVSGTARGGVYLLADMGNGWRYVTTNEKDRCGFVPAEELEDEEIYAEGAFLIPADRGDRVTVYADENMETPAGFYYAGSGVNVEGCSPDGGYRVCCCGGITGEDGDGPMGYVRREDVQIFVQPWEIVGRAVKGTVLEDLELGKTGPFLPQGASLVIAGEYNGLYHVVFDDPETGLTCSRLVEKALVQATDVQADRHQPPRIAYGLLTASEDEGFTLLDRENEDECAPWEAESGLCEIIGEGEDWYQARKLFEPNFFIEKTGVRIITALYPAATEKKGAGEWTVQEADEGLWLLTVEAGAEAHYVATMDEIVDEITASPSSGAAHYSVYLVPGMDITLTGDAVLTPAAEGTLPVILPEHPADMFTETVIFSGSGRFFCDVQLSEYTNYYGYRITPLPGAENSFATVDSLFADPDGHAESETVIFSDPENGDTGEEEWLVDLVPGQFLKLENCILEICYGNG
ncbi:MAG: hypothetical protein K5919_08945 [Clostridiales bacterium]|nr:hypothetical protein [Clostridiales bacterium]